MVQVAIGAFGLDRWFDGNFARVIDLAVAADVKGIDHFSVTDHVVMGDALHTYPYGNFPVAPEYPWIEPLTFLASVAAATKTIRLGTTVLIAPLRPAAYLAKQVASLDLLSGGRFDLGVGVGWQEKEYQACGVPFTGRYKLLDEQIQSCRRLWSETPASFDGQFVKLDRVYCRPFPVQTRLPIWFGLAPTPRNIERIAANGDGWIPIVQDVEVLRTAIKSLRDAFRARGRDPAELRVRAVPKMVLGHDGAPNLQKTLDQVPAMVRAGITMIEIHPIAFCKDASDFESVLDTLRSVKDI